MFHNPSTFIAFANGILTLGMWLGGLFFLKSYRRTKDRLFVFLTISFWVMLLERLIWVVFRHDWPENQQVELRTFLYFYRLLAFSFIALGILEKNCAESKSKGSQSKFRRSLRLISKPKSNVDQHSSTDKKYATHEV